MKTSTKQEFNRIKLTLKKVKGSSLRRKEKATQRRKPLQKRKNPSSKHKYIVKAEEEQSLKQASTNIKRQKKNCKISHNDNKQ